MGLAFRGQAVVARVAGRRKAELFEEIGAEFR